MTPQEQIAQLEAECTPPNQSKLARRWRRVRAYRYSQLRQQENKNY